MLPPTEVVNKKLFDFPIGNGFSQLATEPTRANNILDLVMINDPFLMLKTEVCEPFSTSDHNVVKAAFTFDSNVQSSFPSCQSVIKTYSWKLGDYVSMSNYLLCSQLT